MLLDVSSFGLTGRQAESALLDSGIVTNRNAIPRDPNGAWYTSGVRIGTPALTSRGFGADDFDRVAELIVDVLDRDRDRPRRETAHRRRPATSCPTTWPKRTHAAASELLDVPPALPGPRPRLMTVMTLPAGLLRALLLCAAQEAGS